VIYIETERLVLRPALSSDFECLHEQVFSDQEVTKYVGGIFTEDQSRDFFQNKFNYGDKGPYGFCVIGEKGTNNVVGFAGLIEARHSSSNEYEFGYVLSKNLWGKGYATEIALGQIKWAFDKLGLNQVYALIHKENSASVAVLEKLKLSQMQSVTIEGEGELLVFKATKT